MTKAMTVIDKFSVRFAGDSGDGIQLIGEQLTFVCAQEGWQVQTLPDFPAEIRAPLGTVAGVSGFQLSGAENNLYVSEDECDVLIAFNPAGLKQALTFLKPGGVLFYNDDQFKAKDLAKAGYGDRTLEDVLPTHVTCHSVSMVTQTLAALADVELSHSEKKKSKNFYALGLVHWLLQIPLAPTFDLLASKFAKKPEVKLANQQVLTAGYNFALTIELPHLIKSKAFVQASLDTECHIISGIKAISLALAFITLDTKLPMMVSGYPITPASNILHDAARLGEFGVELFQAEDEISAACAALGASFAGSLAMTCTSGPGLDLKAETLSLAVMAELPLVVIDVQRAGPSTGLPTKTEQTDLLMAVYGRHGEAPLPVIAASSPSDVFYAVIDAFTVAITYMTPVILLLDAQIANASERWQKPNLSQLKFIDVNFATSGAPFDRDDNLSRPWIKPGTPDLMHRLGGLEKGNEQGGVTYDADKHQDMVNLREQKIASVNIERNPFHFYGPIDGELLVLSWGSTKGVVRETLDQLSNEGIHIAHVHLRQLYPLPTALQDILDRYQQCFVAELNQGQLTRLIRDRFLVDVKLINQTNGQPFQVQTLKQRLRDAL